MSLHFPLGALRGLGTLTLLIALGTFSPTGAKAQSTACLQRAGTAPLIWNHANWTARFGERQQATAVTRIDDSLEFSFFHFGSNAGAEPLVLLIGHSASMLKWDPAMLHALKGCYDVYLIDNLGVGYSAFDAAQEDSMLSQLTFEDMGNFVREAIDGIRASRHCQDGGCSLSSQSPHLMGWAMGGKVAAQAAASNPGVFGKVVNLGGNIANNQGATGPNPKQVAKLEGDAVASAYNVFKVNPRVWASQGSGWFESMIAVGARTAGVLLHNTAGAISDAQKNAQARASDASLTELDAIENEVLLAHGAQDDLTECYTDHGDRFEEVCEQGMYCADGIDCQEQRRRPACGYFSLREFRYVHGCFWGLGPVDDYHVARDLLHSSSRICSAGFPGAHGFPVQSSSAVLPAVVQFISGETDQSALRCQ